MLPVEASNNFDLSAAELLQKVESAFESVQQAKFENVYRFARAYRGR